MENEAQKFVLALLAYVAQRDVPPQKLCNLAGIEAPGAEKKMMVGRQQKRQLWLNAVMLTADDCFGLHFGESLQLAALGVTGNLIRTSNTIAAALDMAAALTGLITDLFTIEVTRGEDTFAVNFIPADNNWADDVEARQTLDMLMVFVIHEMDGLVLTKVSPKRVSITLTNGNLKEYKRVMRCEHVAVGHKNTLHFDNKYLDVPIISADYELQVFLVKQAGLIPREFSVMPAFRDQVYQYLISNAYLGVLGMKQVAANLNMSIRTFQRKLEAEHITFKELADKARKTLAIAYLNSGDHQIKEISYMLGYNEMSAFSRTFKRWTGTTPAKFRQEP